MKLKHKHMLNCSLHDSFFPEKALRSSSSLYLSATATEPHDDIVYLHSSYCITHYLTIDSFKSGVLITFVHAVYA